MIYVLSMEPEILARIRQEVLDVVGPEAAPTVEAIKEMKYLRAFLNGKDWQLSFDIRTDGQSYLSETLRLYPPV